MIQLMSGDDTEEEARANSRAIKDEVGRKCHVCGKRDSDAVTLEKCARCKFYFYCGKDCQLRHWKEQGHMGECRQLKILKKHHKPCADKIREGVIRGDPDIPELQKLRSKLGLTRPEEECQELSEELSGGKSSTKDYCEFLVSRKDGTVYFGSTPNPI